MEASPKTDLNFSSNEAICPKEDPLKVVDYRGESLQPNHDGHGSSFLSIPIGEISRSFSVCPVLSSTNSSKLMTFPAGM